MDYRIDEAIKRFAERIAEQYAPKDIYLYGSHARGTANEQSDIDIAVIIEPTDETRYMDIFGKLFQLAADIDGRIEPNLLMDFGDNDKYSFLNEVISTGRRINIA